jgi:hypothetical protein
MSPLNSTEIDLQAISMLFDEPLMVVKEAGAVEQSTSVEISGQNNKGVVFVKAASDPYTPELQQLLSDIVTKGLQFSLEDCAVITWNGHFNWNTLKTLTSVKHLILYGIKPDEMGINRSAALKYVPFTLEETSVIWSDSLQTIQADLNVKKKFWSAMQSILKK